MTLLLACYIWWINAVFIFCAVSGVRGTPMGVIYRLGSGWIGFHWSKTNRRLCVNLVPCVTIWFVYEGGKIPLKANM